MALQIDLPGFRPSSTGFTEFFFFMGRSFWHEGWAAMRANQSGGEVARSAVAAFHFGTPDIICWLKSEQGRQGRGR